MTFGIPKDVWPIDEQTGELDLEAHHQWLETLKVREKSQLLRNNSNSAQEEVVSRAKEVVVPGPMDIMVGLGRQSISSPGYMKFRDLLQDHREEYENADRNEKTIISNLLFQILRDGGYRFVRCTPDGLMSECNEVEARNKISHTFRNMRQKTSRKGRQTGTTKRGNPETRTVFLSQTRNNFRKRNVEQESSRLFDDLDQESMEPLPIIGLFHAKNKKNN
jgi:hypothetical protein